MKAHRFAGMFAAFAVAGCASYPGDYYRIDPLIEHVESGKTAKNARAFTAAEIKDMEDAADTAPKRNAFFERLLGRSEDICGKHLADVAGTGGTVGFGSSWFAAIFSALATANPGAAATNYAATSTVINAGGTAFNANIYHGYITPAIVREIKKKRDAFFLSQVPALKASLIGTSPAPAATRVAIQFHEICSFYNGLIEIAAPNGTQVQRPIALQETKPPAVAPPK